jgi:branched-chain amino acid transport system permease protein
VMGRMGVPFPLAVLIAFAAVALASIVLERLLYSRLYAAGELSQVLFCIGLIFVSMAIARLLFGDRAVPVFLPDYLRGQVHVLGRDFPTYRVFLIIFSSILIFVLWFGVERTRWGAMVRAAVDNRAMAQSIGINTKLLFMATFALGSGLAGLGGSLAIDVVGLDPSFALAYLVYVLIVVSVGGLGSIGGSFAAAVVLGISDMAGKYYFPEIGSFMIYLVMISLLMWRPAGIFGRRV